MATNRRQSNRLKPSFQRISRLLQPLWRCTKLGSKFNKRNGIAYVGAASKIYRRHIDSIEDGDSGAEKDVTGVVSSLVRDHSPSNLASWQGVSNYCTYRQSLKTAQHNIPSSK